jgi:hypothetical protein
MTFKAGLKGGLIGMAVAIVLTLLGLIPVPFLGCVCACLVWVMWVVAGVLAANFLTPPRSAGQGAGAGAIAGLVVAAGEGLVSIIIAGIRGAIGGASSLSSLTPEMMSQLADSGIPPELFTALSGGGGVAAALGVQALCCVAGLVLAAAFGAIGGMILSAAKKN